MNNIEWLKLATSNDPERSKLLKPFLSDDYEFAADGYRIHISKLDRTPDKEETKELDIGSRIDRFKAETAIKRLMIQPQYLIDALQGFDGEEDWVLIDLLENKAGIMAIRLTCCNANNKNEAIVMCMKLPEEADNCT